MYVLKSTLYFNTFYIAMYVLSSIRNVLRYFVFFDNNGLLFGISFFDWFQI